MHHSSQKPSNYTPDDQFERQYSGNVCGVDEAGRGPLAGPVVAAAVILDRNHIPSGLNDSKVLSQGAREHLLNAIMETAVVGIGIAEPEDIDRFNILGATMTAMERAVAALPYVPDAALIDGNRAPALPCPTETIIKGDSRSLSIAAASIVAKVTRDRLMVAAAQRYPGYGFEQHKGYATAAHRDAIAAKGPCAIHRLTWAPFQPGLF